jgi:hypothetical protein
MYRKYFRFGILVFGCSLLLGGCKNFQTSPRLPFTKVETGPGTEDLDIFETDHPYILVSCAERRSEKKDSWFYLIDTQTDRAKKMETVGLPDSIHLDLHGITIEKIKGITYVYAIDHSGEKNWHQIIRFTIQDLKLHFDQIYTSPEFLINPNDLDVDKDGNIYVSNFLGRGKVVWQYLFNTKRSTVVKYTAAVKKWEFVLDHLAYANGVHITDSVLYIATTRMHGLYAYPIAKMNGTQALKGSQGRRMCDIKGLDNLIEYKGKLYTTAHPSNMKFLGHVKTIEKKSPTQIWSVDMKTNEKKLIFQDDGYQISAASTALPLGNKIYIGQIFDPFVGVITLP